LCLLHNGAHFVYSQLDSTNIQGSAGVLAWFASHCLVFPVNGHDFVELAGPSVFRHQMHCISHFSFACSDQTGGSEGGSLFQEVMCSESMCGE